MQNLTMDTVNEAQHEGITTTQDKVLSIVPIPSAILSIFGSSVILYMAISTRRERKWTTYTRLLIGLSVCDIISSVSLAFAAFMRRPESGRVWAIGNDATCTAIGTMTQFSYSNLFFNAMLSYYFMTTVRFQMKHSRIAKFLEPWMHFVSIGYPLVTSLVGATYGMYGEKSTGMGCWVNEYPPGCGAEPGQEPCTSVLIGWMYFGLPLLFSGISIIINNLIIACYVWAPIKSSSRSRTATAESFSSSSSCEFATENYNKQREQRLNTHQLRRLRLVSSQAFLFVISFTVCNIWLGILGIAEAMTLDENEPQLMQDMYYLIVMNAFLSPLQGFLNMLVYIRPKYLKNRQDFPMETKTWAIRRAILGERVKAHRFINLEEKYGEVQSATKADGGSPSGGGQNMEGSGSNERSLHSLPKDKVVSSISLSRWDHFDQDDYSEFSEDLLGQSERWRDRANGDVSNAVPKTRRQSQTDLNFHSSISSLGVSLPFISENAESTFDVDGTNDNSDCDNDAAFRMQRQSSEARWASTTADVGKASQNLDGFNNKQLSTSNHTQSSEARWGSNTTDGGKASQNLDGFSTKQLSTSNHTKSSTASSARLVAPIRVSSEHDEMATGKDQGASTSNHTKSSTASSARLVAPIRIASEHDEMATGTCQEASSLGPQIPAPPSYLISDSPLIAPRRNTSDCEIVDETGDGNKVVLKESTLKRDKRLPRDHDMVKVEATGRKTAKRSPSLKAPRLPPNNDHGGAKVLDANHKSAVVPKQPPASPNLSPVAPRQVPTDFEDSGEFAEG